MNKKIIYVAIFSLIFIGNALLGQVYEELEYNSPLGFYDDSSSLFVAYKCQLILYNKYPLSGRPSKVFKYDNEKHSLQYYRMPIRNFITNEILVPTKNAVNIYDFSNMLFKQLLPYGSVGSIIQIAEDSYIVSYASRKFESSLIAKLSIDSSSVNNYRSENILEIPQNPKPRLPITLVKKSDKYLIFRYGFEWGVGVIDLKSYKVIFDIYEEGVVFDIALTEDSLAIITKTNYDAVEDSYKSEISTINILNGNEIKKQAINVRGILNIVKDSESKEDGILLFTKYMKHHFNQRTQELEVIEDNIILEVNRQSLLVSERLNYNSTVLTNNPLSYFYYSLSGPYVYRLNNIFEDDFKFEKIIKLN